MKIRNKLTKRIIAILLAMTIFLVTLPTAGMMISAAGSKDYYDRVVDANTMDNWKNYFSPTDISTENAGGVWTDKSVFTNSSAFGNIVTMDDSDKNFLTALSAIAANKEVVGYSTVPTDTVLVLDASGSMNGSYSSLVTAANNAITELLKVNENNRVGIVLYSASGQTGSSTYRQSITRLLPIARYTTGNDNRYIYLDGSTVKVDSDTRAEGSNLRINTNKGESIDFTAIEVTEAGRYVYTVKEKTGDTKNVTYDNTVYTVTVDVTDNLDGTFTATYSYKTEKGECEAIAFVNTYTTPEETPVTGDSNNIGLWIALFFVSGGILAGAAVYKNKRKNNE